MTAAIISRLRQPSTVKGLAVLLSLFAGITVSDQVVDAISTLIIAAIGAYEVARNG